MTSQPDDASKLIQHGKLVATATIRKL